MFNLKSLFDSNDNDQAITSLNLKAPSREPSREAPTATRPEGTTQAHLDAIRNGPAMEEIKRRVKELVDAGKCLEIVFFLRDSATKGHLSFKTPNPAHNSLLLFS